MLKTVSSNTAIGISMSSPYPCNEAPELSSSLQDRAHTLQQNRITHDSAVQYYLPNTTHMTVVHTGVQLTQSTCLGQAVSHLQKVIL